MPYFLVILMISVSILHNLRPPLSKRSFPVCQVGKKRRDGRSGFFLFFPNFIFPKLECAGGEGGGGRKKENSFER